MRITMLTLTAVLATAFTARADDPKVDTKAMEVVKAGIKAHGGEENLKKFKGGVMKVKGEMSVQGQDAEFDGKISYMLPDRFKLAINVAVGGQKIAFEQIAKGDKQKMTVNGMDFPIPDSAKESLANSVAELEMNALWPLMDAKKYTVKLGKEVDVDGNKAQGVIVNSLDEKKSVKDVEMYFDAKTNLLVKTRKKEKDEDGKEVLEETYLSGYKEIQGVQTNMKSIVKHDGKDHAKFEVLEMKYEEKIDDKEFGLDD